MNTEQALTAQATQKYLRVAPRKARLVVDLIRGKSVHLALGELKFLNKKSAELVAKVIKSAAANFRDKHESQIDDSDLIVKQAWVDGGAMFKRIKPAPQGRAHVIRKRTSHINIVVAENKANEMINEEA